jgi:Uncharacterized Fe-S protein
MSVIGAVESLWRYPVKSMRGEELNEVFVSFAGIYGDRIFAFHSTATRKGFPYLTGREKAEMVTYRPRFRHPDKAARPPNLEDAERLPPGANPVPADPVDLLLDVETPSGETFAIDGADLIEKLRRGIDENHHLKLMRSDRAMTDCRPVSLFSLQSADALSDEVGATVDKRRFRANIYLDLKDGKSFAENDLVGRSVRVGSKVVLSILERDPRCAMITLDPDTGEKTPALLKTVAQAHEGMAGVYGAVLVEGMLQKGDPVEVLA